MLLMIDNYDSFTYNLVHYFEVLGQTVLVKRNDAISLDDIEALQPSYIVLSPGPGNPDDAGICKDVVKRFGASIPLLGVCLGHQCIVEAYGGIIQHAPRIMHGKIESIRHSGEGVFFQLPESFRVTRYHSLVAANDPLPESLTLTAWCDAWEDHAPEIMGVRHKTLPIEGVQFHPESIATEYGYPLLNNFIKRYATV